MIIVFEKLWPFYNQVHNYMHHSVWSMCYPLTVHVRFHYKSYKCCPLLSKQSCETFWSDIALRHFLYCMVTCMIRGVARSVACLRYIPEPRSSQSVEQQSEWNLHRRSIAIQRDQLIVEHLTVLESTLRSDSIKLWGYPDLVRQLEAQLHVLILQMWTGVYGFKLTYRQFKAAAQRSSPWAKVAARDPCISQTLGGLEVLN